MPPMSRANALAKRVRRADQPREMGFQNLFKLLMQPFEFRIFAMRGRS